MSAIHLVDNFRERNIKKFFFFSGRKREIVLGGGTRLTPRLIWQLLRALPLGERGIEVAADI